jgi:hypothetical protein
MQPLPAGDLRSNLGTWAVPSGDLPAVGSFMHEAAPNELYDPRFQGQRLQTWYFDTRAFDLRKARQKGARYLVLRIRCYEAEGRPETYALSAKTEAEKWREEARPDDAELLLADGSLWRYHLPPHLLARVAEGGASMAELLPVVRVCSRRYTVENVSERWTLDVDVHTDTGLCLPAAVLEYKSADRGATAPSSLAAIGLRPIKLSKFLWATDFARR